MQKPPRPTGVTVLGFWQILVGIVVLVGGAAILLVGVLSALIGSFSALWYGIGGLWLLPGFLSLVAGIGFFERNGWAWTLAIVVAAINIIVTTVGFVVGLSGLSDPTLIFVMIPFALFYFVVVSLAFGPASFTGIIIPIVIHEIIIPALMIYYLMRPHVKAFLIINTTGSDVSTSEAKNEN